MTNLIDGNDVAPLLLTRSEIADLLDRNELLAPPRDAFMFYSRQRNVEAMRIPVPLPVGEKRPERQASCWRLE